MTTTVAELPPAMPSTRKWYKGPVGISVGVFAVAVVAISAIAATSGSGVPVGGMHSPADQQLASDGYVFLKDMSASDLTGADGLFSSGALGTHGRNMEVVVEATSPAAATLFTTVYPGTTGVSVTASGDVLRISGPANAIYAYASNLGS